MTTYPLQKNKGFTIVEMLVAVLIFTLSLAALMTIAARGLKLANQTQKQVVAEYLALEGIEGVRNVRDAAFIRGDNNLTWQLVFDRDGCLSEQSTSGNTGCTISIGGEDGINLVPCAQCKVYYSPTTYSYRQGETSGLYQDSLFVRRIILTSSPDNPEEMIVTVTVSWNNGADKVVYTEDLLLWR